MSTIDSLELWDSCFPRSNRAMCPLCQNYELDRKNSDGSWRPVYLVPLYFGGKVDISNMIPICVDCHQVTIGRNVVEYAISNKMPYNKRILQRGQMESSSCLVC